MDVVSLAQALIRCESVTPARGKVFDILEAALVTLGFAVERLVSGNAPDGPVENLLAIRDGRGAHLAFAGHVDVVPPGNGWRSSPWGGAIRDGVLYGRGAVDMKGAVAAVAAAAARHPDARLTLILTGDEEGPATHGTVALIGRMRERGIVPDHCVVGEPTSASVLGDTIKNGRRGSVNIWIEVPGRQGHVAYPDLADNPISRLVAALGALNAWTIDRGNDWFQPSNLEVTDLEVGNPAANVIPSVARARLSIRFNDLHLGEDLVRQVSDIVRVQAPAAGIVSRISGEAFLTPPGPFLTLVADAIAAVTGRTPALSTTGGTSDARFLSRLCPTVEFGLVNATMHQVDEGVAIADLHLLADIYAAIIARVAA